MVDQTDYSNTSLHLGILDAKNTRFGLQNNIIKDSELTNTSPGEEYLNTISDKKDNLNNIKKRRNTDTTLLIEKNICSKDNLKLKRPRSDSYKDKITCKKMIPKSAANDNTLSSTIDIAFLLDDKATIKTQNSGKLPYSYATLITYAILHHPQKKMTLSEIYTWLLEKFPHFKSSGSGWKNSIRHNLSLNKTFVRIPRPVNQPGKGAYWAVDLSVLSESIYLKSRNRRINAESLNKSGLWLHNNKFQPAHPKQHISPLNPINGLNGPSVGHQKSKSEINIAPYDSKPSFLIKSDDIRSNSFSQSNTNDIYNVPSNVLGITNSNGFTENHIHNLLPMFPNFDTESQKTEHNFSPFQKSILNTNFTPNINHNLNQNIPNGFNMNFNNSQVQCQANYKALLPLHQDNQCHLKDFSFNNSSPQEFFNINNENQTDISNSPFNNNRDMMNIVNAMQQNNNSNDTILNSFNYNSLKQNCLDFKNENFTDIEKYHITQANNVYLLEKDNVPIFPNFKTNDLDGFNKINSTENKEINSPFIFYENKMPNYLAKSKKSAKNVKKISSKPLLGKKISANLEKNIKSTIKIKCDDKKNESEKHENKVPKQNSNDNHFGEEEKNSIVDNLKDNTTKYEKLNTPTFDENKNYEVMETLKDYNLDSIGDIKELGSEFFNDSNVIINEDFLKNIGYLITESEFGTNTTDKSDSTVGEFDCLALDKHKDLSENSNDLVFNKDMKSYFGISTMNTDLGNIQNNFKDSAKNDIFLGSYVDQNQNKFSDILSNMIETDSDWIAKIF
ncbi:hypothetical protein BB561_002174 [Smittium simulii]|uniref:Fork-head domain-containing protein n=1 Tax=Smittium simulii TaxID=133385 RepID=A0A2T9YRH6_9FUNG|nr:hypothetical protein BB561_002174 [Smittium simulii]